jgi:hypothetical protein
VLSTLPLLTAAARVSDTRQEFVGLLDKLL